MLNKLLNGLWDGLLHKKENNIEITREEGIKLASELNKKMGELETIIFLGRERMERSIYEKKINCLLKKIPAAISILEYNKFFLSEKIKEKYQLVRKRAEMYAQEIIVF